MLLNLPFSENNVNLLECIHLRSEQQQVFYNEAELVNYFVTEYPRFQNKELNQIGFAYSYFVDNNIAFSVNQGKLLSLSNFLFSETEPIGSFEQKVLNETYKKSVRRTPSRPNRF